MAYRQQQFPTAIQVFQQVANNASDETGAEAQYLLAEIYYRQKKHQQSLETLFDLNKRYTNYEKWRGRSFLLIADNYIAMDEIFQARATLQSLIDKSPDPEVVSEARRKLASLP
ncbi:MAG: tetratricopeptide repeat protein [Bacteroidia bacterium]|nr:tetratricopeptide repeat protein [Bacteroidia bacterium]